ncbi:MAG: hypothetical protein E7Z89_07645 [Cyanobacteria bacterium SIG28]|nr:hypothetical protein [Cyanobacteria bacterium SIG28]
MTFIKVDTSFDAFNTNTLTLNEKGEQYLDEQEAAQAQKKGAKWAKAGQTQKDFETAKSIYETNNEQECLKILREGTDSIFSVKLNEILDKLGKDSINTKTYKIL